MYHTFAQDTPTFTRPIQVSSLDRSMRSRGDSVRMLNKSNKKKVQSKDRHVDVSDPYKPLQTREAVASNNQLTLLIPGQRSRG